MLTVNVYIIVIYVVITSNYCTCIWLYSPLNSYLYVPSRTIGKRIGLNFERAVDGSILTAGKKLSLKF